MILIDKDIAREQGKNFIPFPDADNNYEPMFYVEDGKELTLRLYDGEEITRKCTYIDSHHFYFGSNCYHIDQFAELCALNRNTAFSKEQITDLSVFHKQYINRELKDKDGNCIPYRGLIGWDKDRYGHPRMILSICPEADSAQQVALSQIVETNPVDKAFVRELSSIPHVWSIILPRLKLTDHEFNLVSAVFEENNREVEHISKREWDSIPNDYKGKYTDLDGKHPDWAGRNTGFLPGHGTKLFIEGVSFVIDQDNSLQSQITDAKTQKNEPAKKDRSTPFSR